MRNTSRQVVQRSAYTLIEIMIVIGIMAALFGIAVVTIGQSLDSARASATKVTIAHLDGLIQERFDALVRYDLVRGTYDEDTQRVLSPARGVRDSYNNASGNPTLPQDPLKDSLAEVIIRKNWYRVHFPQREEDLTGQIRPFLSSNRVRATVANSSLKQTWDDLIAAAPKPHTEDTESSELLYLFLTQGNTFGAKQAILDNIDPKHIKDTDGDELLEFVDAWGNPLQFFNAPTRLIRGVATSSPPQSRFLWQTVPGENDSDPDKSPLNFDPFDPLKQLIQLNTNSFNLESGVTASAYDADNYWDPNTYFTFLIVSSGPDGLSGMNLPTVSGTDRLGVISNVDDLNDNITNRQQ